MSHLRKYSNWQLLQAAELARFHGRGMPEIEGYQHQITAELRERSVRDNPVKALGVEALPALIRQDVQEGTDA